MTIVVQKEFTFAFSTIVLERQLVAAEELNQQLGAAILAREGRDAGIVRSNVGGWHSERDLLRWGEPAAAALFQHVGGAVKDYIAIERKLSAAALELTVTFEAWANVARSGSYAKPHVHPNSNLSGVYYVDAGDTVPGHPHSGVIEFMDPRNRPGMFETEGTLPFDAYRVTPKSGMLLVFPAWLFHHVNPYFGQRPRLCVAFNVTIQQLKVVSLGPATG